MGSTRLPGKVLLDLAGRPVLEWVVSRLSRAGSLFRIVIATSAQPSDDPIEDLCLARGWNVFRGSEEDVLDRYYQASLQYPGDAVVRVTADCPLVDPVVVDQVVGALFASPSVDYASNILAPRTFPRGLDVEAFTVRALTEAWHLDDSAWREHVTPILYRTPDRFRLRSVANEEDLSNYRWTVDTPEDLEAVRALIRLVPNPAAPWQAYASAVSRNPGLTAINQSVAQKDVI